MDKRKSLTHAIVQRFLPATAAVYIGVLAASAIANPGGLSWMPIAVAAVSTVLITAGFGTVAALFRSGLRSSVNLGRRSLIAGFGAPLAVGVLSVFTQGASDATIAVLTYSAGALTGVIALGSGLLKRREQAPLDPEVQSELERLEAELAGLLPAEYALLRADTGMSELRPAAGRTREVAGSRQELGRATGNALEQRRAQAEER